MFSLRLAVSGGREKNGNVLLLLDVVCSDEDLFDELSTRKLNGSMRGMMGWCLIERETAQNCGISRFHVSLIWTKTLEKAASGV